MDQGKKGRGSFLFPVVFPAKNQMRFGYSPLGNCTLITVGTDHWYLPVLDHVYSFFCGFTSRYL